MEKLGKGSVREMGNYTSSSGIWAPNSSVMTGSEESTTERIPFVVELGVLPLLLLRLPFNSFLLFRFSSLFLFVGVAKTGRNSFDVWTLTPRVYHGGRIADGPGSRKGIEDTSWCYGCWSVLPLLLLQFPFNPFLLLRFPSPLSFVGMAERTVPVRHV